MKKTKYILLIVLLAITILLISGNIYASDINNTYKTDNDKTNIAKENNNHKLTNNEITEKTNTTREVYNEKTVVPNNTKEKTYNKTKNITEKTEDIKLDHYTQLDGNDGYMPFYMDDDTIAICIEPEKHSPDENTVYTLGTDHTIINHKNGKNVTDYIKIYLYWL